MVRMIDAMEKKKEETTTNAISLIGASNPKKIVSQKGIQFFKCCTVDIVVVGVVVVFVIGDSYQYLRGEGIHEECTRQRIDTLEIFRENSLPLHFSHYQLCVDVISCS